MMIILMTVMMLFLLVLVPTADDPVASGNIQAQSIASHMALIQTAATEKCIVTKCVSGAQSVGEYLPKQVASGPLYAKNFVSILYDDEARVVVTFLQKEVELHGKVSFNAVNVALRDMQPEQSAMFGLWDKANGGIRANSKYGPVGQSKLPSAIASKIPNNSPVIISDL